MPPKPKVNWLAVRTYYLAGHGATECSRRFGVSVRSIEKRRSSEGWVQQRAEAEGAAQQEVREIVQRDRAQEIVDHIAFADNVLALADELQDEVRNAPAGRSRIEAFRAWVEAADKAARLSRTVRGIKEGASSNESTEKAGARRVVFEVGGTTSTETENLRVVAGGKA